MNILESHRESAFVREFLERGSPCFHDRFDDLWADFAGLEDSHFWQSIDTDASSRIWEMMTARILKREGFTLKSDDAGPDFLACKDGKEAMYVECVAPSDGKEGLPDSVPEIDHSQTKMTPLPDDQVLLRVCAAIRDKKKKFEGYLRSGTINPEIPRVISVGGLKLGPRSCMTPQAGIQGVLGYGRPYLMIDSKSGAAVERGYEYRASLSKSNDSLVNTQAFLSKDYETVSSVLYSDCSFWRFGEFDLFSESIAIHNPRASKPLQADTFQKVPTLWTIASTDYDKWFSFKIEK